MDHKERKFCDWVDILRIFQGKKWPSILGGAGFVRGVQERFLARLQHREIPELRVLAPEAEDILKVGCKAYGVGKNEVLRSRRGRFNEARSRLSKLTSSGQRFPIRFMSLSGETYPLALPALSHPPTCRPSSVISVAPCS